MEDYLLALILLLPLLGGIMAYTFPSKSGIIASIFLSITTILAGYHLSFVEGTLWMFQFEWLPGFVMGFAVDRSSAVLILLVSLISFLVHLFSIFYLLVFLNIFKIISSSCGKIELKIISSFIFG